MEAASTRVDPDLWRPRVSRQPIGESSDEADGCARRSHSRLLVARPIEGKRSALAHAGLPPARARSQNRSDRAPSRARPPFGNTDPQPALPPDTCGRMAALIREQQGCAPATCSCRTAPEGGEPVGVTALRSCSCRAACRHGPLLGTRGPGEANRASLRARAPDRPGGATGKNEPQGAGSAVGGAAQNWHTPAALL